MKTVLIFAGTREGRELVEAFDRSHIACHVCVATEYGSQLLKTSDFITVHTGRLDEAGMRQLMDEIGCDVVVDATHPYAVLVTNQMKAAIQGSSIRYLRLLRENDGQQEEKAVFYENVEQCAKALAKEEGKVLLTTGSKQIAEFAAVPGLKERLVVRVIPGLESLKLCLDAGLMGNQIIAMQGPFSQEMNETIIKEYGICHLVSKESGVTGGVNEKTEAARKLGIKLHILKRPDETPVGKNEVCLSVRETMDQLESLLDISFERGKLYVTLAGIGPGASELVTKEVENAVRNADALFGAKRMLDAMDCRAMKYPYYRREDILPILEELAGKRIKDTQVVILFSGDTGFYSGSKKLYEALRERDDYKVRVLPGISSVAMLSSRIGVDWQDAAMVSLHGTDPSGWMPKLLDAIKYREKTFFITSGVKDLKTLSELLEEVGGSYELYLGYQLSYPEERVIKLTTKECKNLVDDGLYTGLIIAKDCKKRYLVPVLSDDYFIRDQVPMTKEEVRKLSVCQLQLKEGDVVYDIGSGSGSIAVQIGALSESLQVYALECNHMAVELIEKNVAKARLHNVKVLEAEAPEGLPELPAADAAFIGGSKGRLRDILTKLYEINPSMRVVMNAVSLESICQMQEILKEFGICNLEMMQVSVSKAKKLGDYHMLSANNPVFIFSFAFVGK